MNAKIVDKNGVKAIEINGKVMEYVGYRTWRPNENTVKNMGDAQIPFISILCSGILNSYKTPYSIYGEYWLGDGIYDWDVLRRDLDLYVKNAPSTYFAINLMLDTRDWFLKEHPDCPDSFIYFSTACTYKPWRECTSRMLKDTLDFLEREYSEKVFAIILSAGGTCEWHNKYPDNFDCDFRDKAFKEWTGDDNSYFPSNAEFEECSDGNFRNPIKQKNALDYIEFMNDIVNKELAYYAKLVKDHTQGRLLVGAPAGYLMAGGLGAFEARSGASDKLLIDELDIIVTPASYFHRSLDGVSSSQTGLTSVRLNNKFMVHSIDNCTFKGKNHVVVQTEKLHCKHDSMDESINYLRRESAMAMSKGSGFWFFDQYGTNYPDITDAQELGKTRKAFQKMCSKKVEYNSEVAFVVDSKSYIYTDTYSTGILKQEHIDDQRDQLGRIGCPFDIISIYDLLLENFPKNQYKFMIIADCFAPTDEIRNAIKDLRKNGVNFLFMYASGAITDKGFDYDALSDFCGIKIKEDNETPYFTVIDKEFTTEDYDISYGSHRGRPLKPLLTSDDSQAEVLGRDFLTNAPRLMLKNHDNGFDAWSARGCIPYSILKKLAQKAGVYMYHNSPIPTYANSRMAAFFDHKGGTRKITFPHIGKMTEFYSGKEYVSDGLPLEITFNANECKLFIYE